jgi:hypothetical protein
LVTVISEALQPARYPDLTPCDFYLLSSLKDKVCKIYPNTLHELEENIRQEICRMSPAELQRVNHSVFSPLNRRVCLEAYFVFLYRVCNDPVREKKARAARSTTARLAVQIQNNNSV